MTRQEQFARQKAEKRSPAAMARRAARRGGAVAAPVPAPAPAPAPAPSSARAPRSAAAEARRAAKRAAAPVGEAPPKRPKKASASAWGAQADDATIRRNAELRAAFKENPSSLSADDRARAEQLLARDARKAAKKAARGGDSKRAAGFKKRIASDASAGRGRGRGRGGGGRGRGRGR